MPTAMLKAVNTTNNKKKSNELASEIKNGLSNLKNEIEKMSKDEIKIEKPQEIVHTAEKILEFNEQNQRGQGLKILTTDQMLSRLPITLAQLKVKKKIRKS